MPRVRMLTSVSGVEVNYARGDEVDLDGPAAAAWCEAGMAVMVRDEQAETPERAQGRPETAAKPRTRSKTT
ncbi:hypothetical protein ACIBEJ_34345 [Nonomuraea sp. NPDC050790]|uniref:hypothetical protein n=1 Tax=Nonomuraea sp. NPDC050790 TaxID=3364371 RepID=UPI0037BBB159